MIETTMPATARAPMIGPVAVAALRRSRGSADACDMKASGSAGGVHRQGGVRDEDE
ncbi:hypothetical protein [Frankia canadensis]|uniref:hypothetical protein n=1 Tax=Frankia canadensis TaxID=1836972 RepID=UPI001FAFDF99|nr:hypothetical protein [Frankia canadensis]